MVFKKHFEYFCQNKTVEYDRKNHQTNHVEVLADSIKNPYQNGNYDSWRLARNLSAMAYLNMGGKTGETVVKIALPMLAELPFWQPVFLLTGARSPELLRTIKKSIKNYPKIELEIQKYRELPDSVVIKPETKAILQEWFKNTGFQGNSLSDYIKISPNPPAWNILEFAGSLMKYEKSLNDDWFSGDKVHIKEIFDINSLQFKPFNAEQNRLEYELSLVKIFHQEAYYKYYLFSKVNQEKIEVQLDWGRLFVLAKQAQSPILKYHKKTFELISSLPLPFIFERGLTLLSGKPPSKIKEKKQSKKSRVDSNIFKNVPYKIALLVANKLGQNLKEV